MNIINYFQVFFFSQTEQLQKTKTDIIRTLTFDDKLMKQECYKKFLSTSRILINF